MSSSTSSAASGVNSVINSTLAPGMSLERAETEDPELMDPNTWTNTQATSFDVRIGPNYKSNRKKSASLPSLYDCVAIDMYASDKKIPHIARCVKLPTGDLTADELDESYLPPCLIINCMIPAYAVENMVWGKNKEDGLGYSLVFYYVLSSDSRRQLQQRRERIAAGKPAVRYVSPASALDADRNNDTEPSGSQSARGDDEMDERAEAEHHSTQGEQQTDADDVDVSPALRLLHRFMHEESRVPASPLRQRLKAITRIVNLDAVNINGTSKKLVERWNGTPFLIKTTSQFHRSPSYFECDVDVHRFSYLARCGLSGVRESLKTVVFDFAFVIEGHSDEELPEQIMSAARLSKLELSSATQFPQHLLAKINKQ